MATTVVGSTDSFKNAVAKWNKNEENRKSPYANRSKSDDEQDVKNVVEEENGRASSTSSLRDILPKKSKKGKDEEMDSSISSIKSLGASSKPKSKSMKTPSSSSSIYKSRTKSSKDKAAVDGQDQELGESDNSIKSLGALDRSKHKSKSSSSKSKSASMKTSLKSSSSHNKKGATEEDNNASLDSIKSLTALDKAKEKAIAKAKSKSLPFKKKSRSNKSLGSHDSKEEEDGQNLGAPPTLKAGEMELRLDDSDEGGSTSGPKKVSSYRRKYGDTDPRGAGGAGGGADKEVLNVGSDHGAQRGRSSQKEDEEAGGGRRSNSVTALRRKFSQDEGSLDETNDTSESRAKVRDTKSKKKTSKLAKDDKESSLLVEGNRSIRGEEGEMELKDSSHVKQKKPSLRRAKTDNSEESGSGNSGKDKKPDSSSGRYQRSKDKSGGKDDNNSTEKVILDLPKLVSKSLDETSTEDTLGDSGSSLGSTQSLPARRRLRDSFFGSSEHKKTVKRSSNGKEGEEKGGSTKKSDNNDGKASGPWRVSLRKSNRFTNFNDDGDEGNEEERPKRSISVDAIGGDIDELSEAAKAHLEKKKAARASKTTKAKSASVAGFVANSSSQQPPKSKSAAGPWGLRKSKPFTVTKEVDSADEEEGGDEENRRRTSIVGPLPGVDSDDALSETAKAHLEKKKAAKVSKGQSTKKIKSHSVAGIGAPSSDSLSNSPPPTKSKSSSGLNVDESPSKLGRTSVVDRISMFAGMSPKKTTKLASVDSTKEMRGRPPDTPDMTTDGTVQPRRRRSLENRISVFEKGAGIDHMGNAAKADGSGDKQDASDMVSPRRRNSLENRISVFEKAPLEMPALEPSPRPKRRTSLENRFSLFEREKSSGSAKGAESKEEPKPEGRGDEPAPRRRRSLENRISMFEKDKSGSTDTTCGEAKKEAITDDREPRMRRRNSLEHRMAMFEKDKKSNSTVASDAKTSVSDEGRSSRKKSLMDRVPWTKATVKKGDSELSNRSDHDGNKRSSGSKKGSTTGTTKTDSMNGDASPTDMGTKADDHSTDVPSTPEQMSPIKSKLPTVSLVDIDPPESPGFMASPEDKRKSVLDRVQKFQKKNEFSTKPALGIVSPRFLKPKHPTGAGSVEDGLVKSPAPRREGLPVSSSRLSLSADLPLTENSNHAMNEDQVSAPESLPTPPPPELTDSKGKSKMSLVDRIKTFDSKTSSPVPPGRTGILTPRLMKKKTKVSDEPSTSNAEGEEESMKSSLLGDVAQKSDMPPDLTQESTPEFTPFEIPTLDVPVSEIHGASAAKEAPSPANQPPVALNNKGPPAKRGLLARKSSGRLNKMASVSFSTSGNMAMFRPPTFSKDHTDETLIEKALRRNFVFDDLNEKALKVFIAAFEECRFSKGDTIISEGEYGDYFYVIARGKVRYEVKGVIVVTPDVGQFGELSLLYMSPHTSTVKADAPTTRLFRVDQKTFRFIMQKMTQKLNQDKLELLKGISFLQSLVETDLNRLSAVMVPRRFLVGDRIIAKGDEGDAFYIVKEGEMNVTAISFGKTRYEDVTLGPGDHFGERALVTKEPASANVVALSSGTLFFINKATFEKVLGDYSRVILKSADKFQLVSTAGCGSCVTMAIGKSVF
jgi:cAMP-dependent protein kinase regulator